MNEWTRFFLVLLRIAIGWHLLVEGLDKVHSVYLGETVNSKPFTSKSYLQESTGPLRPYFVGMAGGDPDEAVLARVVVTSTDGQGRLGTRLPPGLKADWKAYFDSFVKAHEISGEALKDLQRAFEVQEDQTVDWFLKKKKTVTRKLGAEEQQITLANARRVQEYQDVVRKVRGLRDTENPLFGRDVAKRKLSDAKEELAARRAELLDDIDDRTKKMKQALVTTHVLQVWKNRGGYAGAVVEQLTLAPSLGLSSLVNLDLHRDIAKLQKQELDAKPPEKPFLPDALARNDFLKKPLLGWVDWFTRWGLTVIGACLILGLFTRTACIAGALLLLLFYLAMPPFPWLPNNPRAEGHYLIINKNVIEILALLTLATTRSGLWVGLDALVRTVNPFRRRGPDVLNETPRTAPTVSARR
ncbi:MAG: DoxX family protein [Gemmataceae bacterium]|nr:DoxX family protein [Gemmataceae bacterium]